MCVMADLPKVGIRELRQNLSVYVKKIREEGRTYEVTEHGRPVARLTPLPGESTSVLDRMIAEGRATRATRDLLDIKPLSPEEAGPGRPLSEILQEMRDEEPW
jgi:prevent-host-death family protein